MRQGTLLMKVTCRGRLEQEMERNGPCEHLSIELDLKLDLPLDFSVMQAVTFSCCKLEMGFLLQPNDS